MDDLDKILSSEELVEPSSGFASAVMDAVYRQAAEPPPLPFPWLRFATGVAACGVMAAAGTILAPHGAATLGTMLAPLAPLAAVAPELGYAAVTILVGFGITRLPRLLAPL